MTHAGTESFASFRSVVCAGRGMVATSQPLAALEAVRVLEQGGNAVDAAVTASILLGVLEPMQAGIGGDVMALVYRRHEERLYGLNAAGRAPARASLAEICAAGTADQVAPHSVHTVTVPGAVAGWIDLLTRFGTIGLPLAFQPAIRAAESGFAVAPHTAATWAMALPWIARRGDSARTWLNTGGSAPRTGERFCNPRLAASLRMIAEGGRNAFYDGPLARQIVQTCSAEGGCLVPADFTEHRSDWVEPLIGRYRGQQIAQLPPSTQGVAVLQALRLLEQLDPGDAGFASPQAVHWQIEAIKAAFADTSEYVADPGSMKVTAEWMLDEVRLGAIARSLAADALAREKNPAAAGGDTAFVCVADQHGDFAAVMASLFVPWGSGITAGDSGILLHNRGHGFSLRTGHANAYGPRKRPRHTILPAMLLEGGCPRLAFGFVGGDMQVQAQLQFLCNVVDHGMNLQQALDAPRWRCEGSAVALEPAIATLQVPLAQRGHQIAGTGGFFGGGQAVAFDRALGSFQGGSDGRRDGCALGY